MADEEGGAPATTQAPKSGAGTMDDFNMYFVRLIVVIVWMVYLMPVVAKFIGTKQSKWQQYIRSGWDRLTGKRALKNVQ